MRALREAAAQTIGRIDDHSNSRDAVLDFAAKRYALATEARVVSRPKSITEVARESIDAIALSKNRGHSVSGRETRFRDLDQILGGWHGGKLYIVAARPGMGKSAITLQIATDIAKGTRARPGAPVLFISVEMKGLELGNRVLCSIAGVDGNRLRTNKVTPDDDIRLLTAAESIRDVPLFIVDDDSATLAGIKSLARKFRQQHGEIGMIVVDYLQLMSGNGDDESREREMSNVSRGLKKLTNELDVPIVALSQLNRGPETRTGKDKRPRLADLRESGAIEQDADVVIFIYRDEVYNKDTDDKGIAEIIVEKQRGGATGTVRLRWVRECTRFDCMHEEERDHAATPESVATSSGASAIVYPAHDDPGPAEPDRREPRQTEPWGANNF